MIAVHAMSAGAQAVFYFIAFVAFLVAAIVAWVIAPRLVWATLIAVGLTMMAFVLFYNALALS